MAGLDLGKSVFDGAMDDADRSAMLRPAIDPVDAAFELGWESTPVGALARIISRNESEADGGKKINPRELNEMFPGVPEKFSEPLTMRTAQDIYNNHQRRAQLQEAVSLGSQSFTDKMFTGAAGLLPHFIDPINVGSAFATGAVTGAMGLTGAAKFGASVAENIVQGVALEPIQYFADRGDMQEYSFKENFTNILAMSLAFPAVELGARKLFKYVSKMDARSADAIHTASLGNLSEGRSVDAGLNLFKKQIALETQGTKFGEYSFAPLAEGEKRPMFAASREYGRGLQASEKELIGADLGDGVMYLSDNPNVANGSAARAGFESPGQVFEVNLENARILNLDSETASADLLEQFKNIDNASDAEVAKFREDVQALGYDGIAYKQDKVLGEDHPPHNVVALFDQNKAAEVKAMDANREFVPKLSQEEMSALATSRLNPQEEFKSKAFVADKEGILEAERIGKEAEPIPDKVQQIKQVTQDVLDDLKEMEKQEILDAGELKELEEIKRLQQSGEKLPVLTAQALSCIRG